MVVCVSGFYEEMGSVMAGRTLWEMLTTKKVPIEQQITNPLKAKLGSTCHLNEIDMEDMTFVVKQISDYEREIGDHKVHFTDYDMLARPLDGDDIRVKMRLNPMENPDQAANLTHDVLLLRLIDEMAYSEDFHKVVNDTTKKFEFLDDKGACKERFFRINDVQEPYKANITFLAENQPKELQKSQVEYWDYWMEKTEAGITYLFVEMDTDNGWFQLWRGGPVNPQTVTMY